MGIASHHIAGLQHRIASWRSISVASCCVPSYRIASRRITSHHVTSHHIAGLQHRIASLRRISIALCSMVLRCVPSHRIASRHVASRQVTSLRFYWGRATSFDPSATCSKALSKPMIQSVSSASRIVRPIPPQTVPFLLSGRSSSHPHAYCA